MTQDTNSQDTPLSDDGSATAAASQPAPVRVPNVSAGAVSGLDHEVIGANAQDAHAANQDLAQSESQDAPTESLEDALARIQGLEDYEERRSAADQVWADHHSEDDADEDANRELAAKLTQAVHGGGDPADPADGSGDGSDGAVVSDQTAQEHDEGTGDPAGDTGDATAADQTASPTSTEGDTESGEDSPSPSA